MFQALIDLKCTHVTGHNGVFIYDLVNSAVSNLQVLFAGVIDSHT